MGGWWWVLIFVAIGVVALAVWGLLGLQLWRRSKELLAEVAKLSHLMTDAADDLRPATSARSSDEPARSEWAAAAGRQRGR